MAKAKKRNKLAAEWLEDRLVMAAGDLDTTFNPSGALSGVPGTARVAIVQNQDDMANGMRVQPWDHKVVLAGDSSTGAATSNISVARFNADGSIDGTFGQGGSGTFTTSVGDYVNQLSGVDFQTIGGNARKIVVAGYTWVSGSDLIYGTDDQGRFIVGSQLRDFSPLDIGLTLDITGGTNWNVGTYTITAVEDMTLGGVAYSVAILNGQPAQNPIDPLLPVANGEFRLNNYDFLVMRFTTAGVLDTSFNEDGIAIYPLSASDDYGYAIRVQPWDDKIVIAGYSEINDEYNFSIMRLNPDGDLDESFFGFSAGPNGPFLPGSASVSFGADDFANTLDFVESSQQIIVGGSAGNRGADLAFVRLNPTGTIDTSFGTNGKATFNLTGGRSELINSLKVYQSGPNAGKIIATGTQFLGTSNYEPVIVRLNANGTLDTTFSSDGFLVTSVGTGQDWGNGVDVQADNKVVVVGSRDTGTGYDVMLMRFNNDGTPDNTFSAAGTNIVTTSVSTLDDFGATVEIIEDNGSGDGLGGRIMVGGSTLNTATTPDNLDFLAIRYLGDPTAVQKPVLNVERRVAIEHDAGNKNVLLDLTLSAPATEQITVNYTTVDGTAKAGVDYVSKTSSVTFSPGQQTKTITVQITGNTVYQASRSMSLAVTAITNATIGEQGGIEIRDNDGTWQNVDEPTDVDGDGDIDLGDVVATIDDLNRGGSRQLTQALTTPSRWIDVDGDTIASISDLVPIIDMISRIRFTAGGLNASFSSSSDTVVIPAPEEDPTAKSAIATGLSAPIALTQKPGLGDALTIQVAYVVTVENEDTSVVADSVFADYPAQDDLPTDSSSTDEESNELFALIGDDLLT